MANCKERIIFLDYAKILCTILVVYGHVTPNYDPVRLCIYGFHMPFFFFISGMLYKPLCVTMEIKKTISNILIPTLIYILIAYIIKCACGASPIDLFKITIVGFYKGQGLEANIVCWFLLVLANIKILASMWFNYKRITIILLSIGLLSFHRNLLFIAQTEIAFIFFIIGFYCKSFLIKKSKNEFTYKYCIISIILLTISFLLTYLNGRVSMLLLMFGNLPFGINIIVYFINAIIGTLGIIFLSLFIKRTNKYIILSADALISCVGLQNIFYSIYLYYFGYQSFIVSVFASISITIICILCHQPLKKILNYFR